MKDSDLGVSEVRAAGVIPARIMVVDDDPFVRMVIANALAQTGAAVKVCSSGVEACAEADDFQPGLVLLDLRMQGMDGRATWRILHDKIAPAAQLIFLTAEDDDQARAEIMNLGAAGIITKPFDPAALAASVQMLLGGAPAKSQSTRFENIAAEFRQSLGPTMEAINDCSARLRAGGWQKDLAEVILLKAHMLAGSAGLFQLHAIGDAADRLEGTLRGLLKSSDPPSGALLNKLEMEIGGLASACRASAA
jgi:two-component system OmpR family response regulator